MSKKKQLAAVKALEEELDDADSFWDDFDDFDSDAFWAPRRHADRDYLDSMWGRRKFRLSGKVEDDLVIAHGMVEGFLNAFARDGRYRCTFDPNVSSAATSVKTRNVLLTPAPILDDTISASDAGRILTGLAVHEISHPRYGANTRAAVSAAFNASSVATQISNLLDDVRIERRFVEDYPGYSGIFDPTLDYVGKGQIKRYGGKLEARAADPLNVAIAAVRFPDNADWTDAESERDWWQSWADRWSREDAPRRHVKAVRLALLHLLSRDSAAGQSGDASDPDDGQSGPSQGAGGHVDPSEDGDGDDAAGQTGSDDGLDASGDDLTDDPGQDDESDARDDVPAQGAPEGDDGEDDEDDHSAEDTMLGFDADNKLGWRPPAERLPTCITPQAVEGSATGNGVDRADIDELEKEAKDIVEEARFLRDDGLGGKIDALYSTRGILRGGDYDVEESAYAARHVRDALMASRTGHTATTRFQKRGSLDQHALHRVARRDTRLFSKRRSTSVERFRVWIMVDTSSSMWGSIYEAAAVAMAIASATQHVKTVNASIWGWSTNYRDGSRVPGSAARVWKTGEPLKQINELTRLRMGGTPDAPVLSWAVGAIQQECRGSERPVIIFCSDGWGDNRMSEVVSRGRREGVDIVSVAIGQISEEVQRERFGEGNYVAWQGSITETARPLAKMIARMVGKDRR